MKKLVFSVFAATLAFGASAEDVDTTVAPQTCCGYDGFYLGLGVAASDGGVKTETTYAYDKDGANPNAEGVDTNDHDTKFTGTFTLGFGKVVKEKAYVALEAQLDAGSNSNFYHAGMQTTDGKIFEVNSRSNGLIPSVGLKFGYIHPETKGMVYFKAGAALSKAKTSYEEYISPTYQEGKGDFINYSGQCNKWSPIIALGGEKLCGKNVRARIEAEYRFGANKKFDYRDTAMPNTRLSPYGGTIKVSSKDAITLRAMAVYTIRH